MLRERTAGDPMRQEVRWTDLTYEQIAELHNRPVGTVKTQMRSALQKLRQVLS